MRAALPIAACVALLSAGSGLAFAKGGGVGVPNPPHVRDVTCINTCAGVHKATTGSKVEAVGRHFAGVTAVVFAKQGGGHLSVKPDAVRRLSVRATVPDGATDGRPQLVDQYGNTATSPNILHIVPPDQIPPAGDFKLQHATTKPEKSYFAGMRPAKVTYTFSGSQATDVRITVVHMEDRKVVASFVQDARDPFTQNTARWVGRARDPMGDYRFRIGPVGGTLASTAGARFTFHRFKFPVRGAHTYGDGFGAPRDGHTHMGQDVMASCGTPLVAARGGVVQYRGYQAGGAGNYIVIDGRRDNHDYMYAHLRRPARVHEGHRVKTGQRLGAVGDTGDATACHLHFEYWTDDWWNGGKALSSVTRVLQRWDTWS